MTCPHCKRELKARLGSSGLLCWTVWCENPKCTVLMNDGAFGATKEEAYEELISKYDHNQEIAENEE